MIQILTTEEVWDAAQGMEIEVSKYGVESYQGFHYFNPKNLSHFSRNKIVEKFICAFHENELIGIGLVQKSPYYPKEEVWWISYIDVHRNFRRRGIATRILQEMNRWAAQEIDALFSSKESNVGKEIGMHKICKKNLKGCRFYTSEEEYYREKVRI